MNVTRRSLLCGCACCAGLFTFRHADAQADAEADPPEDEVFICSADERIVQDEVDITEFSAGESGLEFETRLREFGITDYGTAMASQRWRRGDGQTPNTGVITLGCFFLSGSDSEQELVRKSSKGWLTDDIGRMIQFDFDVPQQRSEIRVHIGPGGNNSRIGRQAMRIAKDKPTLNLTNVRPGTIQHEFGHALGLLHEHLNPGFDVRLKDDVVIADMAKPPNNWSEATTRLNILNRFGRDAMCVGDPNFNRDSIMMYEVPGRWTENGQSFHRASKIHDRDLACVRGIYSA